MCEKNIRHAWMVCAIVVSAMCLILGVENFRIKKAFYESEQAATMFLQIPVGDRTMGERIQPGTLGAVKTSMGYVLCGLAPKFDPKGL